MLIYCTFITNLTVISYFFLKLISYTLEISKITKIALALENTGKKKNVKVKTEFLRRRRKIVASSNEHALCHEKSIEISLSLSLSLTLSLCIVRGFGSREEPGGSIGRSAGRLRAGARWQHLSARAPSPGPRAPNWATLRARAHTHTHARTPLRHASLNNGINRPWRVINCRCQPDMTVYSAVRLISLPFHRRRVFR